LPEGQGVQGKSEENKMVKKAGKIVGSIGSEAINIEFRRKVEKKISFRSQE